MNYIYNYINKYISNNENIMNESDNRSKVIDYILLLKLIMINKGFYFHNNFYVEWVHYLLPYIEPLSNYTYNDYNSYNYIICKYNINHNLFNINEKKDIELENNFFISIIMKSKNNLNNMKVLNFNINIFKNCFLKKTILSFNFTFPLKDIFLIGTNIWNYDIFNEYIENLWVFSKTLEMDDYIYSTDYKKILYYEIFKKIVLRILIS
jgi:hypothetical protein